MQVITRSFTIALPVVDLHYLPTATQEAETRRLATEERSHFTPNPLLRICGNPSCYRILRLYSLSLLETAAQHSPDASGLPSEQSQ